MIKLGFRYSMIMLHKLGEHSTDIDFNRNFHSAQDNFCSQNA